MKKLLSVILTLVLLLSIVPMGAVTVGAEVTSGTTGDCTWSLDGTVLTISGNGEMGAYEGGWDFFSPWGSDITKVIIKSGVTNIGDSAFYNCDKLKSVQIPDTVTSIGDFAFQSCTKLKNISISKNAISIGDGAFNECKNLTNITIPNSIMSICGDAFDGCEKLKYNIYENGKYLGNEESPYIVLIGNTLSKFSKKFAIANGTKVICPEAVYNKERLEDITIPDSVTCIGYSAFDGTAFEKDENNWKDGVLYIGNHCIAANKNVPKKYTIKNGTKTIAEGAFSRFSAVSDKIKKITIPESVISIGSAAFSFTNIEKITIPKSVKYLGNYAFGYCENLKKVTLLGQIESVESNTFSYCKNLKEIAIPKSVKRSGFLAFNGCENLEKIYYGGTKSQKNDIYFYSIGNDYILNAKWYYDRCGFAEHEYKTNQITKATQNKNGKLYKECKDCGNKTTSTIYEIKTIKLEDSKFTYNGKTKKPTIVVKDSKGKTISDKYYTVTGTKSAKSIGKYKITIKFKTRYSGTKKLTYEIAKPTVKKSSVSKLTAGKKQLKVSIKKASSVSGYEIQYSTSSKFKSYKKKTTSKTNYTIKSLTSKKTYYVRVRSYKTIGSKKFYSAWSTAKSKKTK